MTTIDRLVLYGTAAALVVVAIRLKPLSDVSDVTDEIGAWTRAVRQTRTGFEAVGQSIRNAFSGGE
jgi:hypothetical protein